MPAVPLYVHGTGAGRAGQTASAAAAAGAAPLASEYACTTSACATQGGIVTVPFSVPSAALRTVRKAQPCGLSWLASTRCTMVWGAKPAPHRETRPPATTRGGVAASRGERGPGLLVTGGCWRAGAW